MRTKGSAIARRAGFTLIEMLVVIVIIVILMGVVFRLARGAMAKSAVADEQKRLAVFKALIEEFHAEYGSYPPVPVYNGVQPISFRGPFPENGSDLTYWLNHYRAPGIFQFGLLSFFVNRTEFGERVFSRDVGGRNNSDVRGAWEGYNDQVGDNGGLSISEKDESFVKRIEPILSELGSFGPGSAFDKDGHTLGFEALVWDSWQREYVYVSEPPYQSYLIFSKGPDGKYDKDHPGDRTRSDNRDNVYGDLEDK